MTPIRANIVGPAGIEKHCPAALCGQLKGVRREKK
jgi:hypothetical protein